MIKAKANFFRTLLLLPVVLLVAVAAALFGLSIRTAETQTTPASTTTYYKVQDLGTLGGSRSYASAINDSGQVVGDSYIPGDHASHAFLYDSESATPTIKDLGTLGGGSGAKAINDSGQVVGWSDDSSGKRSGFLYDDSTNGMKDLNTLIPADSGLTIEEGATAISSDGQIAVRGYYFGDYWSYGASSLLTPATTTTSAAYEVQRLPSLENGYSGRNDATDINDTGQVVGIAWYLCYSCGDRHAFLYDSESVTPTIQDLGDPRGYGSYANGINDSGQVVGSAVHAFLYDSINGMKDLGTLGGTYSEAKDINNSGQVVGSSSNSSGKGSAFLYDDSTNGMKDLNTLIPADSGWTISASAINSDGQIAATGSKDGVGTHALLLTPTSDIPAPKITSPNNPNTYDSNGSFIVSGSAAAGSIVELFEGETSTEKTTKADSSTGAWSIDLIGVSEGAHTYSAKVKDAAGNTSPASNSVTVTVDTAPPTVKSVTPSDRATGVSLSTTPVTATFSEDMDPNTLNDPDTQTGKDKSFTLTQTKQGATTAIPVTVSYEATTKTAKLTPSTTLAANTKYTATVKGGASGAKDKAGNALGSDKVWSFTTKK